MGAGNPAGSNSTRGAAAAASRLRPPPMAALTVPRVLPPIWPGRSRD